MTETCWICRKKLSKIVRKNLAITDRLLSVALDKRKIETICLCDKCGKSYSKDAPDGWGVKQWRETLAIFAAGCLAMQLQDGVDPDMAEPQALSQLVLINLLNSVGDKTLKAALDNAQKKFDTVFSDLINEAASAKKED